MGYRPASHRNTIFVWQVAVAPTARRRGLGLRMLRELAMQVQQDYDDEGADRVQYMEASVTPSNDASRQLFDSFARHYGVRAQDTDIYFSQDEFPEQVGHETEYLLRMGPFGKISY